MSVIRLSAALPCQISHAHGFCFLPYRIQIIEQRFHVPLSLLKTPLHLFTHAFPVVDRCTVNIPCRHILFFGKQEIPLQQHKLPFHPEVQMSLFLPLLQKNLIFFRFFQITSLECDPAKNIVKLCFHTRNCLLTFCFILCQQCFPFCCKSIRILILSRVIKHTSCNLQTGQKLSEVLPCPFSLPQFFRRIYLFISVRNRFIDTELIIQIFRKERRCKPVPLFRLFLPGSPDVSSLFLQEIIRSLCVF